MCHQIVSQFLIIYLFVEWLKYPVIGTLVFLRGHFIRCQLMCGYTMTEEICRLFYELSSLKQCNTFKQYLVCVTVIYSWLCEKSGKEQKEMQMTKEREKCTGRMPGFHGLRHFIFYT